MTAFETAMQVVQADKVREFARAVRAPEGDAAVPTFGVAISAALVERLLARVPGLDPARLLHGEHSFAYLGAIMPGMELHTTARIVSDGEVARRRGGTMRRIEIGVDHVDLATGHSVLRETMVVVEVGAP